MSAFSQQSENRKGSIVDKVALFCALVSVACVLGAHAMDKLAQSGGLPSVSFNRGGAYPNVDYSATATIPNRANANSVNPCGR
jgi:hypothetical protein